MAQALDFRLELRYAFLRAIEISELRSQPESLKTPWIQMKAILEPIRQSHSLGVPVPEAFSTKIQRRLASTMPPRPIVQLSFEDTYGHFKRLFVDGIEVTDVLKYSDSQSLLVCSNLNPDRSRLNICSEFCPVIPSQEATAFGVYPDAATELPVQRHGVVRLSKHSSGI